MTDERKQFLQRILWTLLPGMVAGMMTGGIAYGTIQTQVEYMQRDIARIEDRTSKNREIFIDYILEENGVDKKDLKSD